MTVLETLKAALEASLTPSPTVIAVGLAIVLLIPAILHFLYTATTPYATLPSVLLLGPSGSGKTALLTLFERGPFYRPDQASSPSPNSPTVAEPVAQTHTSQTPCTVELAVGTSDAAGSGSSGLVSYRVDLDAAGATAKKFLLIDTPGHPKLRTSALAQLASVSSTGTIRLSSLSAPGSGEQNYSNKNNNDGNNSKSTLKALVFLVDAAALAEGSDGPALAAAAEYLYEVLLALQRRHRRGGGSRAPSSIPVLVAANKLDLFTALPAALVKSQLEAEIGRIRKARSKGLLDSGEADGGDLLGPGGGEEADSWLGAYSSEKFSFKEMLEFDIEVDVIGGNVLGEGPGADKWWKWIGERIYA
ncbi:uncharacterized protein P884DRAFT_288435 [Thermothelomyces heterothallicus CBS 202.75]|uniref:uncharacterized protein n=1 Tax=Thermothelomyces heterothallicus CBS 202.75 TaxID=1149848 RepID=UPI003742848F